MFKNIIEINDSIEDIKKLLETDNFDAKTSKVSYKEENNKLLIIIESNDIISLRASINGVTTMLSVYFQSKQSIED